MGAQAKMTRAHEAAQVHRPFALSTSFTAWRIGDCEEAIPLETRGASTLADAVNETAPNCLHKNTLHILERDDLSGKQRLHVYAIKQGAANIVRNPATGGPMRLAPLKPVLLYSVKVSAFAPVEPWRAF